MIRYSFPFILYIFIFLFPSHPVRAMSMCTMEAKICPDGSYVSRTGPECEFAPCPSEQERTGTDIVPPAGEVTSGPPKVIDARDVGLGKYPDHPVEDVPVEARSVKFIIEHRTALNGRDITVRGVIVSTLLGEKACPSGGNGGQMGRPCAMPRIIVADTDDTDRNTEYDLTVLLPYDDETVYESGNFTQVTGTVTGNIDSVNLNKK